jgi:L-ascorbate metabolism protein UlaG (beta-lactamase superfamily)
MACKWMNVKKLIGMHFDTFPYIQIDHSEALMLANFNGVELILLEIGKTINI